MQVTGISINGKCLPHKGALQGAFLVPEAARQVVKKIKVIDMF